MIELLAPAGSYDSLRGAVNAGCDAVYIGGTRFGARAYADNPDTELMKQCLDFCHMRGKKLYMTVNTLLKDKELEEELYGYIAPYYEQGLDAVIVQDPGVMDLITREFPGLDIHASTQCTIMTAKGIESLRAAYPSITRVVPARELSVTELKRFRSSTDLEMEVFVHGALCYCYSGQCLLSSVIGGRSGNRGRCAQPCRKKYNDRYLLSPKDMCTLESIPELIDIGIDSFKIEGRMKSPEYTAGVVSTYRDVIDRYLELGPKGYMNYLTTDRQFYAMHVTELKELYNRGGFNSGYLHDHNGPQMMTFDRPNHSGICVGRVLKVRGREAIIELQEDVANGDVLEIRDRQGARIYEFTVGEPAGRSSIISTLTMKGHNAAPDQSVWRTKNEQLLEKIQSDHLEHDIKVPVHASCSAHEGEALTVGYTIVGTDHTATLCGQTVQTAQKAPTESEQIAKQLRKTGETDFVVADCDIDIKGSVFVSVGELNNLRRDALEQLRVTYLRRFYRKCVDPKCVNAATSESESHDETHKTVTVSCWKLSQVEAALEEERVHEIIYNLSSPDRKPIAEALEMCSSKGVSIKLGLPVICRYELYDKLEKLIEDYSHDLGFVVRNQEELVPVRKYHAEYRTDRHLYVMNRRARGYYSGAYTLPLELNSSELRSVAEPDGELIVYGYQAVMVSAQCTYKNTCNRCHSEEERRDPFGDNGVMLVDELEHDFRSVQLCEFCQNLIFNSACLDITKYTDDLEQIDCGSYRYEFTFEDAAEVRSVLKGEPHAHLTAGHFHRGVQ